MQPSHSILYGARIGLGHCAYNVTVQLTRRRPLFLDRIEPERLARPSPLSTAGFWANKKDDVKVFSHSDFSFMT
jgi:hypothetical protein